MDIVWQELANGNNKYIEDEVIGFVTYSDIVCCRDIVISYVCYIQFINLISSILLFLFIIAHNGLFCLFRTITESNVSFEKAFIIQNDVFGDKSRFYISLRKHYVTNKENSSKLIL